MVKLTLIMSIKNDDAHLEHVINSILNQSFTDFELICVDDNSTDYSYKILEYHSINDKRVKILKNDSENFMQVFNKAIIQATGEYILLVNSRYGLKEDVLDQINTRINQISVDLLLFKSSNKKYDKIWTYMTRIVQRKTFNHKKISGILFDIDNNPFNCLYAKELFTENDLLSKLESKKINEEFFYKTILEAKRIFYQNLIINANVSQTREKRDINTFNEYIATQNNLLNVFSNDYRAISKNNKIKNIIREYEHLNIKYKKKAYNLIRDDFKTVLDDENFINELTKENRKLFEQVIITETVEEYELLKKIYHDKNDINIMTRHKKILKTEHQKIRNFNRSLTSSNSWKATKIFRIIK